MEEKLDIIIKLLTEINSKLPGLLQAASEIKLKRPRKLTEKQVFHKIAMEQVERLKGNSQSRMKRNIKKGLFDLELD